MQWRLVQRPRILAASLSCLIALPTAAAAGCRVIDATEGFWPLAARGADAATFRAEVIAKFPELYTRDVLGADDPRALDKEAAAALAGARRDHLHARVIAETLARDIPQYVSRFEKSFPDFRCNFPIYLMISLGHMDGAGRVVDGKPALVLGVDVIDRMESPEQIPVFFAHELFHRYHFEAAGFSDDPGERQAIWRTLWAEGLATYVSAQLNPGRPLADAMIFPRDLAERAAPQIRRLARALHDNDAPNPKLYASYFETSSIDGQRAGIPPRAGYYVGYRVAALAARKHRLNELAHLRGPALHRDINRWLDELTQ